MEIKVYEGVASADPRLKHMLTMIEKNMPEISRATSFFGKTQSQFMDNMLTVSHPTPIRNMRQCLAEIEQTNSGLQEAFFTHRRKKLEIALKFREMESEQRDIERKLLQVDIEEYQAQLKVSEKYISGAIRKITNFIEQYNLIASKLKKERGISEFTELDFEEEEELYHIKTAFAQALTAARSRNGIIDEGNHIYFYQIGINGAAAQMDISNFLMDEGKILVDGDKPHHKHIVNFLDSMAKLYAGCSKSYCVSKGMDTISKFAILDEKPDVKEDKNWPDSSRLNSINPARP